MEYRSYHYPDVHETAAEACALAREERHGLSPDPVTVRRLCGALAQREGMAREVAAHAYHLAEAMAWRVCDWQYAEASWDTALYHAEGCAAPACADAHVPVVAMVDRNDPARVVSYCAACMDCTDPETGEVLAIETDPVSDMPVGFDTLTPAMLLQRRHAGDRLARHVLAMAGDPYLEGHPEWEAIVADARAVLGVRAEDS